MTSPVRWQPGASAPDDEVAPASPSVEALAAARAAGRAEVQAELWALHDRLTKLCTTMHGLQQRSLDWLAGAALEVAFTVIEAWLEGSDADRRARLSPIVEKWLQRVGPGAVATAYVSEVDAAVWRDLVAELPIAVQVDRGIAPGDVRLRGERAMIELTWRERLAELRGELLAALPEMPATNDANDSAAAREAIAPAGDGGRSPHDSTRSTREHDAERGVTRRWARIRL